MQIKIKGKNVEVSEALQDYAGKKLQKVEKFFSKRPIEADVTFNIERGMHIVDITLLVDGLFLRGESKTDDMYHSIDSAVDKIERQIEKYKTKINRKFKSDADLQSDDFKPDKNEYEPKIVRSKKFILKPMGVEEAVMQMDLLNHDFYVFSNADTDEINVIYRRKDGNYGLIEPER